jgi:hypothetical protein
MLPVQDFGTLLGSLVILSALSPALALDVKPVIPSPIRGLDPARQSSSISNKLRY